MTYQEAKAEMDAAFAVYDVAVKAYRAREIGDAEFLAARAIYKTAEAKFDEAFAAEAGWTS